MALVGESVTIEFKDIPDVQPLPAIFFNNPGKTQGVIVLQEWWGMNEQIQEECKEIAENGNFTTIVPDLYRGKVAIDREEAGHLMTNLDWPGALRDIQGCAKFLLDKGCTKVGVTGFCMGGALSLAAAGKIEEISAAAPFYGICKDELCDPSTIRKPLQCHFGAKDQVPGFSDPPAQAKLKEKLDAGGVPHDFYVYDAGHAFTNRKSPFFDEAACNLSLKRMYEFFQAKLK